MKRRFFSAAVAAVVLMALFTACGGDPEDVNIVGNPKAAQVASVTVTQPANLYAVIVSWDAIPNGTSYTVYLQQDGKKTVINAGYGQCEDTYTTSTADQYRVIMTTTKNTDSDKWSAKIDVEYTVNYGGSTPSSTVTRGDLPPGKYRFGVGSNDADSNHRESDIKWSSDFTVASPGAVVIP